MVTLQKSLKWVTYRVIGWVLRALAFMIDSEDLAHPEDRESYFSMTMLGLSQFFRRLDPMVEAGVSFDIINDGIMVYAFIPKSQLRNMLVREDW